MVVDPLQVIGKWIVGGFKFGLCSVPPNDDLDFGVSELFHFALEFDKRTNCAILSTPAVMRHFKLYEQLAFLLQLVCKRRNVVRSE